MKKQAALIEKKKQSEADKEEKEKKNQKDKERKQQIKAEKEAQKAEKKAEKKRLKEEQAAMAETEVVGKINPIGATIVFILFATFGVLIMVGVWLLPRRANIKEAAMKSILMHIRRFLLSLSRKMSRHCTIKSFFVLNWKDRFSLTRQMFLWTKNWKPFMRCFKDWICTIKNKTK